MAVLQVITGPQDGLLQSARTMVERCVQFHSITVSIPRFAQVNINMTDLIARIDAAIVVKQSSRFTATITLEKNTQTTTFLDDLGNLADVVVDMAIEKKNMDWEAIAKRALKTKTKASSAEGQLATATEFLTFVRTIDAKLLAYYGIEDSEITGLEDQIKEIKALRLLKEVNVDQKTLDNQSLASLFKELKKEKATMLRLSKRFIKKAPAFFAALEKAAVINIKAGSKTVKTEKEKTPEQLAVIAAKKAVVDAKKAEVAAKKADVNAKKAEAKAQKNAEKMKKAEAKTKKTKATVTKQTTPLVDNTPAAKDN